MRSKLFRSIIVDNLDQLLSLSVGFRRNMPLPAPPAVASVLRSKAIEFLEKWNASFGIHYRQLRLGFEYLKNTLKFQFPNLQANAARIQQEIRERERRSREILINKFHFFKDNFSSFKEQIMSTVDEIGECLDIVRTNEESMPLDEDFQEFRSSELMQIRLDTLKEGEKVHENSDNKVVFDALRELYKLLETKHLVSIQEWISLLLRVEVADNRFRDSALKELIDIRNRLKLVKKRCEESGCDLPKAANHEEEEEEEEEEEDFWEEGKIGSLETKRSTVPNKHNEDLSTELTSNKFKNKTPESINRDSNGNEILSPEAGETNSNPLRSKLLAEAPVMTWGSFLDRWGSNRKVLANQRGLELESHWGRVDYDAVIPAEKIAELNVHATLYKEQETEIQPCRAPLSKGGLCHRRDLRVCPFHGPIIPRDDEGKPLNQNSSNEEISLDLGIDSIEQLAKQAVNNVRERDKQVAKKRETDKLSLKRAKLAKIREHNETVLRDAALASTSRSAAIGEDMGLTNGDKRSARNKKETLSSMLHKKVTPKDRIAQRLLNTRAKDATTRQLTLGEDANYREAFPNQW